MHHGQNPADTISIRAGVTMKKNFVGFLDFGPNYWSELLDFIGHEAILVVI